MILKANKNEFFLKLLFVILLLADLVYTYQQNYHSMLLEGDMSAIVIATGGYKKVLEDPFGFSVLFHKEHYPATNRFFIHWFMQIYCKNVPLFVQNFTDPINSVFVSIAFARTAFQALLIFLIAIFISGSRSLWSKKFLIAALILTPFFQIAGFAEQMAVTDNSITYSFFYSLPLIFILLYFLPFYNRYILNKNVNFHGVRHLYLIVLLLVICFGGSLGAPVILIVCSLSLLYNFITNFKKPDSKMFLSRVWNSIITIDGTILVQFTLGLFIALYSFYIGTFNSENSWFDMPMKERYFLLAKGFVKITTFKLGIGFLMAMAFVYTLIINLNKSEDYKRYIIFIKWLGLFCFLFILLLPLGGYRAYRPLIIRYDTFSPVTIAVFIAYGLTAMTLLANFAGKKKLALILMYLLIGGIYTNADKMPERSNACQRESLQMLAESDTNIVKLNNGCWLMTWVYSTDYKDSELNAQLIQHWRITKKKVYYHLP